MSIIQAKLKERELKLAPYVPSGNVPSPDELNDVSDFIDTSSLLSSEDREITTLGIDDLLKKYKDGSLKAEKVTLAYCRRLALAQKLVNCVSEVRFDEALEEARREDEYFAKTGQLCGPLHGIVITLKDNIKVKGLPNSLGLLGLATEVETEDAAMTTLLKKLGGLIIAKSNTPSGILYSETVNMLFGRTLNPYSRKYLNAGGSSGGEGTIAALRGSCFGVGSDLGGSVRHPAALNNVYSIKPSVGRTPCYGTLTGQPGQESVQTVYGILSKDLDNVEYALKAIVESRPYEAIDATCLPLEYRKVKLPDTLTIAFLDQDGLSTATAPIIRGLQIVKEALKRQGHDVIEWPTTYLKELEDAIHPFYSADGYKPIRKIISESGEPLHPLLSKAFDGAKDLRVSELWELHQKRSRLVQEYLQLWNTHNEGKRIDAIIMPVSAFPACLNMGVIPLPYTEVWNALDYSVSTFPVTRCDTKIDRPVEKSKFISELDRQVHRTYAENLDKFEGGPVALQLVCNRLEEEKCLAMTKYVRDLLSTGEK
ncbi:DEKNAAC103123 [Brettanomyces naardenensis]|uniref:DEKNAAC103123 n=1 Tax=Brettanomyces naardenensis TaxID=13370 RepID=A0A448YML1_BRENA|nr:DEKNAAC103123 [Brettanomyces naardenensis]